MKTIRCRFRKAANFSGGVLYSVSMLLLSLGWSVAAIPGRAAGGVAGRARACNPSAEVSVRGADPCLPGRGGAPAAGPVAALPYYLPPTKKANP